MNARTPAAPVIVCSFAIFIFSGMDAAMRTLVIAIGVYNVIFWQSTLATVVSGSVWSSGPWAWPANFNAKALRLELIRKRV